MTSEQKQLIKQDLISVLKHTAFYFGPLILAYILQSVKALDFGSYTTLVGLICGVGLDLLNKYNKQTNY